MLAPIEFDPGLYRGPAPRTVEDLAELASLGITTVINLERRPTMTQPNTYKIRTLWHPMGQVFPPMRWRRAQALNALQGAAYGDRKVYVCCREGKDRTGLLVATLRVVFQGWSKKAARKEMKERGNHWWLAFWRLFV